MLLSSNLVVREGEEAVVVQQHVDQVGELPLVARAEEAVTDHVNNLFELRVVVVVLHGVVAPGLESVHVLDQSEGSIVVT